MVHNTRSTRDRQLYAHFAVQVPRISMLCYLKPWLPFVITVTTSKTENQNHFYVLGYTSVYYSSALSNAKKLTAAINRMKTRHYLKR